MILHIVLYISSPPFISFFFLLSLVLSVPFLLFVFPSSSHDRGVKYDELWLCGFAPRAKLLALGEVTQIEYHNWISVKLNKEREKRATASKANS